MIQKTSYKIDINLLDLALQDLNRLDPGKLTLNYPTGNFFYDHWVIKEEYKGTIWENILNSLGESYGEARIITMPSKTNYVGHCDIDDRWHLNLTGKDCFLVDLESKKMFECLKDGYWYKMNAGLKHSAVNFGNRYRHQLVVRCLLNKTQLNTSDSKKVKFFPKINDLDEIRYEFDNRISPLLNWANKKRYISNFELVEKMPTFFAKNCFIEILEKNLTDNIGMELE